MWLHSLKVAQLLRSAACLHTNQSRSYLNHLVLLFYGVELTEMVARIICTFGSFYESLSFDYRTQTLESFNYSTVVRVTKDLCQNERRNEHCSECSLMEFYYRIREIGCDGFRIEHGKCIPSP